MTLYPTIHNPPGFLESVWDWGMLDGCFGASRIKPTDLDGLVEHHGRFLVIETKSPNVNIPAGQLFTLQALQRTGLFTVLIVWGAQNKPEQMQIMTSQKTGEVQPCNRELLRDTVKRWYYWAHAIRPV